MLRSSFSINFSFWLLGISIFSFANGERALGEPPSLSAMTFNIRLGSAADGENAWPKRRALLFDSIKQADPDVLGLQEALRMQLREFNDRLPHLVSVGAGCAADGGGEYSSILFRRDRFDLWESGTFWLSDTPNQPGSTSWGNTLPRICVWARLFDRQTKQRFYVFNTHWDHQSQPAREGAGALIAQRVEQRACTDEPVIVMGDFNVGSDNPARAPLVAAGLRDSFVEVHPNATDIGTFNAFQGRKTGAKIDAVLVSKQWKVLDAEIDHTEQAGRTPSDHYAVWAQLEVRTAESADD